MTWDERLCEACWIPATTQGAGQCQEPPTYLIVRFVELYTGEGEPVGPDHDIYTETLRWFCGPHAIDWLDMEPDCKLVPLSVG